MNRPICCKQSMDIHETFEQRVSGLPFTMRCRKCGRWWEIREETAAKYNVRKHIGRVVQWKRNG